MKWRLLLGVLVLLGMETIVQAANDASIPQDVRSEAQTAMRRAIDVNTVESDYIVYDAVEGKLRRLTFQKLHDGMVKKGDFYVSCADFTDTQGNAYDLDFLVAESAVGTTCLGVIIHADGDIV